MRCQQKPFLGFSPSVARFVSFTPVHSSHTTAHLNHSKHTHSLTFESVIRHNNCAKQPFIARCAAPPLPWCAALKMVLSFSFRDLAGSFFFFFIAVQSFCPPGQRSATDAACPADYVPAQREVFRVGRKDCVAARPVFQGPFFLCRAFLFSLPTVVVLARGRNGMQKAVERMVMVEEKLNCHP